MIETGSPSSDDRRSGELKRVDHGSVGSGRTPPELKEHGDGMPRDRPTPSSAHCSIAAAMAASGPWVRSVSMSCMISCWASGKSAGCSSALAAANSSSSFQVARSRNDFDEACAEGSRQSGCPANESIDEPLRLGVEKADRIAGQQQVQSIPGCDEPGEPDHGTPGRYQAELHLRRTDLEGNARGQGGPAAARQRQSSPPPRQTPCTTAVVGICRPASRSSTSMPCPR